MSGVEEVAQFLNSIGLENCIQAVVHNGFYTSMEALKGATYEELVDSGVRPVHARLIMTNLDSKGPTGTFEVSSQLKPQASSSDVSRFEEVASFLRSVGLENCAATLSEAGYTSLEALSEANMQVASAYFARP